MTTFKYYAGQSSSSTNDNLWIIWGVANGTGAATKIEGKVVEIDDKEKFCMVRKEPIGVVGQIVPWNYPLLMMIWQVDVSLHLPLLSPSIVPLVEWYA